MKLFETPKILTDGAEEIIDILMEGTIEKENVRFEIGKKLFQLEEKLHQKKRHLYKIITEEILRQLPNQQGISPASLSEMKRFYKAKAYFLTNLDERNS
ncbi:MAG: hypothetical protein KDK96_07970 [Chlamydiia bacterium]|nr:hypothetical protein [Chlamydiia bacterium]MCB9222164.1 hypothetical protein [Ignavibacteria bacterium]